jgi:polysaccharide biosynthesis PFTS motif protein
MILLVPEINFSNFFLYFILSFLCQVKTYKIQSYLYRFRGRIKILNLSDYFDWEKCIIIKSDAVKIWEDILPKFPTSKWQIKIKNHNLNLSLKAKQELQKEIEKLLFLKHILSYYNSKRKACIINSLKFEFLSDIDKTHKFFSYPTIGFLSTLNILLDIVNLKMLNLYYLLKVIFQFIHSLIHNQKIEHKIKYIYDGISPRELSIDKDKITFTWIVDDELIHKRDILFLVPHADFQMKAHAEDYTRDNELLATPHFDMLRLSSPKILFSCFSEVLRILVKYMLSLNLRLRDLMCLEYSIRILKWLPLVESLRPAVYINSSSNLGSEDPAVIYFKAVGIKTLIWFYGTNSYLFSTQRECDFRNVIFCHILSSNLVVWNQHFKEFIEEHPQDGLDIKILGPLMSGDESVLNFKTQVLCKNLELPFDSKLKYIAIFDSPSVSPKFRGNSAWCPDSNSEEYNYTFIRDTYRLLSDFQNIILIYKPKRSLTSGKFTYSAELKRLFNDMEQNPKVIVLDYNINPWIPIALGDIFICMPFESPAIAALHYGKPGLFHDPLGITLHHRYQNISGLITHNYQELKLKVRKYLYDEEALGNLFKKPEIKILQGALSKGDSSNKFREYINSLLN